MMDHVVESDPSSDEYVDSSDEELAEAFNRVLPYRFEPPAREPRPVPENRDPPAMLNRLETVELPTGMPRGLFVYIILAFYKCFSPGVLVC